MATKTTAEILREIGAEATEARSEMGSAKTGLVRPNEISAAEDDSEDEDLDEEVVTEEEPEQDLENTEDRKEDDPDEETEGEEEDPRERNREAAARRVQEKKDAKIAELEGQIAQYRAADTEKEQADIKDKIAELSTELKLDPVGLGKIATVIIGMAEERWKSQMPSQEMLNEYENRQEEAHFNSEWKSFAPTLSDAYPKMSAVQLEEAKTLMDELSHDDATGGLRVTGKDGKPRLQPYPLDYIMFKNKSKFDSILSAGKRRGLESADVTSYEISDDSVDMSTARGIEAADKKYSTIESSSSGLRRGRSPKNRSI